MKKIILALFVFCLSGWASAQTNVLVQNLSDNENEGSLRWAINLANANVEINEILFAEDLEGTITLASNFPTITRNLTVSGPGAASLTISGNNQYQMFLLNSGIVLTISGLTFSQNGSFAGSVFRANRARVFANDIIVNNNLQNTAFYSNDNNSSISITNALFSNNSGILFGSDHGSTPSTTSENESDYTNRITVTNSTFSTNSNLIFRTERYVKIDDCIFLDNTAQIGNFRGLNRYQVLNSTFTNNTGSMLFSFYSALAGGWGLGTLGENHHLFEGNSFSGNTGTIINPGSSNEQQKTTIINNVFSNNGGNWSGTPIVAASNALDNFLGTMIHDPSSGTLSVTMVHPVYGLADGTTDLEGDDFEFILSGGNATLGSSIPSSITKDNNTYVLGIDLVGDIFGTEELTLLFKEESIFDSNGNFGSEFQNKNLVVLSFPDIDEDGVPDYLDACLDTPEGAAVNPATGCVLVLPLLSDFNPIIKNSFMINFEISQPSSNSEGAFYFASSNPSVATMSGSTVQIIGPGETTITATQAADGDFLSHSTSTTLTVEDLWINNFFGGITNTGNQYINAHGKSGSSVGLTRYGEKMQVRYNDGLSMETASTSAYQIKQDYPEASDGLYWIVQPTLNGGDPFQIYADMTTDGGGWTLIMCNVSHSSWTFNNAILTNQNSPSLSTNYSIIAWADAIKKSASGFQFMMEATSRNRWGGIFTANQEYTFVKTDNSQTDISRDISFDTYPYSLGNSDSVQPRMPWRSTYNNAFITTDNGANHWWGTLISNNSSYHPAPWISSINPNPGKIWYWVR